MKYAIFGAGGVGGFFGGQLALAGQDVWFLARGEHLAAMQRHGLRIHSPEGTSVIPTGKMTDNPETIGPCDTILFCVKSYDTEEAAQQMAPLLNDQSVVISLQNGIDNEQKIKQIIPFASVLGGVAYIYSHISAPGQITESGGPRKMVVGPLPDLEQTAFERGAEILNHLSMAGIDIEWQNDIRPVLWKKFIFIASVSGLTALSRLTLAEILAVNETRRLLADAMGEVHAIAAGLRIPIEPDHVASVLTRLRQFRNETRSSLYYDLIQGKPMELEALSGSVVRCGKTLGVPTPVHSMIYAALLPYAVRFARVQRR